jgi:hypothetical protein
VKRKPIALFSGREAAMALKISQMRLSRAIRRGTLQPDYVTNAADLFSLKSIRQLDARKEEVFPS